MSLPPLTVAGAAAAVRCGALSARSSVEQCLERIARLDGTLNAFTRVLTEQALEDASEVDRTLARGGDPGPLAGVPFAVKNLFDIEGVTTLAGSIIDADNPPATRDAFLVARLRQAGAILVGALNMDEYAYGFTTENAHYGATRNPHDPSRIAGGSSGGSAAAVAAGIVPLTLGSDTNGSIRVPASFCGIYGLKPTFGALSRRGVRPFVHSLDHAGLFTRTAADLALTYAMLETHDPLDPASATCRADLSRDGAPIRVARLDGLFETLADPVVNAATGQVARALKAATVSLPGARAARSAAFCLTAAEGGALHLPMLRARSGDYDPATRDRLLAGALLPAHIAVEAQRRRRAFLREVLSLFAEHDVLIAPTTPFVAQAVGQPTVRMGGAEVSVRANAGLFAQPFSFIGLPALSAPVVEPGRLPVGVQLIAAPWREDLLIRVAGRLEADGVIGAGPVPAVAELHAA